MPSKIWDIFIGWLFTSQGIAFFAAMWGIVITVLTAFTEALTPYAPLSYGVAFFVTVFFVLIMLKLWRAMFRKRLHDVDTFLELNFDGDSAHFEKEGNIWGWRIQYLFDESTTGQKYFWISVCFTKFINARRLKVTLIEASGNTSISCTVINFEQRYANIQLSLIKPGRYRIDYLRHENS